MFKKYLNSTLALSQASSSGSIVESYVYDAYGNVTIRNGSGTVIPTSAYGNRFLFQGREYDYTTQLYHFRARWYDPETGRWLSNDPIGISGGLNLYAFCNNDPVNFVDPMGLDVFFCRSLVPGGHAWVKIGGKKYNTNGDTGTSYGGYPSELFGGKPMLIESPDEHENDWFVFYRRYETTPEVENELENWIKKTYYIEGSTSEDECERNKNPIYDLFSYNCRDFSESIEYQLNMILFPPTPLMNRRNFLPLIDLPKF
jgi:RHS repeat-associated protein